MYAETLPTTVVYLNMFPKYKRALRATQATEFNFSTPHKSATISTNSHWAKKKENKKQLKRNKSRARKSDFNTVSSSLCGSGCSFVYCLFVHSLFCVVVLLIGTVLRRKCARAHASSHCCWWWCLNATFFLHRFNAPFQRHYYHHNLYFAFVFFTPFFISRFNFYRICIISGAPTIFALFFLATE